MLSERLSHLTLFFTLWQISGNPLSLTTGNYTVTATRQLHDWWTGVQAICAVACLNFLGCDEPLNWDFKGQFRGDQDEFS